MTEMKTVDDLVSQALDLQRKHKKENNVIFNALRDKICSIIDEWEHFTSFDGTENSLSLEVMRKLSDEEIKEIEELLTMKCTFYSYTFYFED